MTGWISYCLSLAIVSVLKLCLEPCQAQLSFNEALSSPSHINVKKNSAIWLHWNYTYSSGGILSYENQEIIINDTIQNQVIVVAEKIGENGQLQVKSGLSSEWINRLTVFGKNNTLMVKNMEYNDSTKLFQSNVYLKLILLNTVNRFPLEPANISISVTGVPEYLSVPSSNMEVAENSNFIMVVRFDGNPKPSGEFQWSHQSSKTVMAVQQEYPYSYKGIYQLGSISSSYCGRVLTTKLSNSVGSAADKTTTVTVLLNLDALPNLRAGKPNQSCVQVTWQKKESGLCNVNYAVKFKNASGVTLYQESGNNIAEVVKCGISSNVNITEVELVMTSTKRSKSFTASVQQSPLPPPTTIPPTTIPAAITEVTKSSSDSNSKAAYAGLSVVIIILLAIIATVLVWNFKLRRKIVAELAKSQVHSNVYTEASEAHYMGLQKKDTEAESKYATLQQASQYESIQL